MAEPEYEPMQQRPLFPGEGQVDGHRSDEAVDRRAEGRHQARVLMAIGEYLANGKRRRR